MFTGKETEGVTTQSIDHLGLVAGMIQELGVIELIDTLLPSQKKVSHGQAVAALILNGLGYVNKRLYLTPRFFEKKALSTLLGGDIKAQDLNDDTLLRTLDACFAYGVTPLFAKIAAKAVSVLGLTCKQLHLDSTSFHLHGDYERLDASTPTEANQTDGIDKHLSNTPQEEDASPTPITVTHGYSRDHRPDLPQVGLNLIVENSAGIPMFMQPLSGNINDKEGFNTIVKEHIASLQNATASSILVADAALYSASTLKLLQEQNRPFISRVPASLKEAKTLIAKAPTLEFTAIDEHYRYYEIKSSYGEVAQRWILIQSSAAKTRDEHANLKKIQKTLDAETKALTKLSKARFGCREEAQKSLDTFTTTLQAHTVAFSDITLVATDKGKRSGYDYGIHARLEPNETYAKDLEAQSGLFILATTTELEPHEVLKEYKAQQRVEGDFRFLKSPEFLSDGFFVKKPERIEALLMIMTLCLLVYAAIEHKIRTELQSQNKQVLNQLGKPTQTPTARWVFETFYEIQFVHIASLSKILLANLKEENRMILDLLGPNYWKFYMPEVEG